MAKITHTRGKSGLYRRSLVPSKVRQKTIQRISGIPEAKRSSDHWWELGETVALNGLLKQDESLVQEGMKYLKKATQMDPPSVSAFMDLGWLLMYRQMELFALEYFEQAARLSSTSRDLYALLAICHARLGKVCTTSPFYKISPNFRVNGVKRSNPQFISACRQPFG